MAVHVEVTCHQISQGEFDKLKRAAERFVSEFPAVHIEVSVVHHCGDGRECDPEKEGVPPRMNIRTTIVGNDTLGSFAPKLPTLLEHLGISNRGGTVGIVCLLTSDAEGEPESCELDDAEPIPA